MQKIILSLIISLFFFVPQISQAFTVRSGDFIYISKEEVVEGNLYFTANSVSIEGVVEGDLIGLASNININGQVKGDLISVSQNLTVNGLVEGNMRSFASNAQLNGDINKNINFLGENFIQSKESTIGMDLLLYSIKTGIHGNINGSFYGQSLNTLISGQIDKNVDLSFDKNNQQEKSLSIQEGAVIGGSLKYLTSHNANIKSENIEGDIISVETLTKKDTSRKIFKITYSILSAFIILMILNRFLKNIKLNQLLQETIQKQKFKPILAGFIIIFVSPFIILFSLISIIGIPLAIALFFIYLTWIYLAKIILSLFIGRQLNRHLFNNKVNPTMETLIGLVVLILMFSLPYIGSVILFIATIYGSGLIFHIIKNKKYANKSFHF